MPSTPFAAVAMRYPSLCSRSCRLWRRRDSSSMRRMEGCSTMASILLQYSRTLLWHAAMPQRVLRGIDLRNEARPLALLHRDQRYANLLLLASRPFTHPPALPKRLNRLLPCCGENLQGHQRKGRQGSLYCQAHALAADVDALALLWAPACLPVHR